MPEEKNSRLAQTKLPDGTVVEREWTPHERYMLYSRGFKDGAGVKAMRKDCEGLGAYERGYDEGRRSLNQHVGAYAKEIGYIPTVLRTAEGFTEERHCTCQYVTFIGGDPPGERVQGHACPLHPMKKKEDHEPNRPG